MTIRIPLESDLSQLARLFDAYRVFYNQPSDLEAAAKFVRERYQLKDSVIFMAFDDENTALGFTQLYHSFTSVGMSKTWLLNDLFVDSNHRKKGVAKGLMNLAKDYCQLTHRPKIVLETGHDNGQAQKLYEQLGYKRSDSLIYELKVD